VRGMNSSGPGEGRMAGPCEYGDEFLDFLSMQGIS